MTFPGAVLTGRREGEPCFCSWSGGKDSCLALHRAISSGMRPKVLLTMLMEDGGRSRSHGLPVDLLERQAASLGLRLMTRSTSWDDYEANFIDALDELADDSIRTGIFGDIDLEPHRHWVERVCMSVDARAVLPLWETDRRVLLDEFLSSGFRAVIVSIKDGVLDPDVLGRKLDRGMIGEFEKKGIDASGEEGEYHSFVCDGPIFTAPVEPSMSGTHLRDGYWFLDLG